MRGSIIAIEWMIQNKAVDWRCIGNTPAIYQRINSEVFDYFYEKYIFLKFFFKFLIIIKFI